MKCPICGGSVRPGSRQALCLRCRTGFANLRVVDDQVDDGAPTIVARGGYPPSLREVVHGDDD